jgi:hypothetical protein
MTWHGEFLETAADPELACIVRVAIDRLLEDDRILLEIDVQERSISHRLAMYLQELLPKWHVDCEYNRDGHEPKMLNLYPEIRKEDDEGSLVLPDIIVHKRTKPKNLLVVEIKKSTTRRDNKHDLKKLTAFREQLFYAHALFLEIGCGDMAGQMYAEWV